MWLQWNPGLMWTNMFGVVKPITYHADYTLVSKTRKNVIPHKTQD